MSTGISSTCTAWVANLPHRVHPCAGCREKIDSHQADSGAGIDCLNRQEHPCDATLGDSHEPPVRHGPREQPAHFSKEWCTAVSPGRQPSLFGFHFLCRTHGRIEPYHAEFEDLLEPESRRRRLAKQSLRADKLQEDMVHAICKGSEDAYQPRDDRRVWPAPL
jgi:hypothetical protein